MKTSGAVWTGPGLIREAMRREMGDGKGAELFVIVRVLVGENSEQVKSEHEMLAVLNSIGKYTTIL